MCRATNVSLVSPNTPYCLWKIVDTVDFLEARHLHINDEVMGMADQHAGFTASLLMPLGLSVNVPLNLAKSTLGTQPFPFFNHKECIK